MVIQVAVLNDEPTVDPIPLEAMNLYSLQTCVICLNGQTPLNPEDTVKDTANLDNRKMELKYRMLGPLLKT